MSVSLYTLQGDGRYRYHDGTFFEHKLSLKVPSEVYRAREMREWCEENFGHDFRILFLGLLRTNVSSEEEYGNVVILLNGDSNAVLAKLRWS